MMSVQPRPRQIGSKVKPYGRRSLESGNGEYKHGRRDIKDEPNQIPPTAESFLLQEVSRTDSLFRSSGIHFRV